MRDFPGIEAGKSFRKIFFISSSSPESNSDDF